MQGTLLTWQRLSERIGRMQHRQHHRVKVGAIPGAALRAALLPGVVLALAILILVIQNGGAG
jgi:hypothetical protein